jgi:hypothetical protein
LGQKAAQKTNGTMSFPLISDTFTMREVQQSQPKLGSTDIANIQLDLTHISSLMPHTTMVDQA